MEKKLKICHVITQMIVGGAQENTLYTCQGLLENGHDVTLVTGPSPGPEGELLSRTCPEGLKIIEVSDLVRELSPKKDWRAYKQLREIFREQHFDVVHTHASKAGILGRIAARKEGVPFVVHTVHGQPFFKGQFFLLNWFYIAAEWYAARYCDKIFAEFGMNPERAHVALCSNMSFLWRRNSDLNVSLRAWRPKRSFRC